MLKIIHFHLGVSYFRLGELDKVIYEFEKAREYNDDPSLLLQIANCYDIAKTFGYQGNYGQWVKEIISGDLSVQYSVDISFDYKSFTYGWDNSEVELNSHTFLLDSRFTDE